LQTCVSRCSGFLKLNIMKKVILLIVLAFSLSINAQESKLSKTDEVLSKAVEKGIAFAEKTGNEKVTPR